MNIRGCVVPALLIAALAAGQGRAGSPAFDTPEDLVAAYWDSLKNQNWEGCSVMLHPEAGARFKEAVFEDLSADTTAFKLWFELESAAEYRDLSPETVFARTMTVMMQAYGEVDSGLEQSDMEVLGSVYENDLAHVVYRVTNGDQSTVTIQSVKRYQDTWRVLLASDLQQMVDGP